MIELFLNLLRKFLFNAQLRLVFKLFVKDPDLSSMMIKLSCKLCERLWLWRHNTKTKNSRKHCRLICPAWSSALSCRFWWCCVSDSAFSILPGRSLTALNTALFTFSVMTTLSVLLSVSFCFTGYAYGICSPNRFMPWDAYVRPAVSHVSLSLRSTLRQITRTQSGFRPALFMRLRIWSSVLIAAQLLWPTATSLRYE